MPCGVRPGSHARVTWARREVRGLSRSDLRSVSVSGLPRAAVLGATEHPRPERHGGLVAVAGLDWTHPQVPEGCEACGMKAYNGPDEYSVLIGYPAQRPVSRLYSERQGACVAEYRRNAT